MSFLDQVTILCEGIDQGLDVRLLEIARHHLERDLPGVARVTIRPAGSKAELPSAVRAHRTLRGSRRVYAVRDRDFLSQQLVEELRAKAIGDEEVRPFPLSRHCMESYLIDPEFAGTALGCDDIEERLVALARGRFWIDVCRSVLDDAAFKIRRLHLSLGEATPASECEARDVVRRAMEPQLRDLCGGDKLRDAEEYVATVAAEFAQHGPEWQRVDGKELMRALDGSLQQEGRIRPGTLLPRVVRHAEEVGPPVPLVDDLRLLVARLWPLAS